MAYEYTENPALICNAFVTSKVFGQGRELIGLQPVASKCDELLGDNKRRFLSLFVEDVQKTSELVGYLAGRAGAILVPHSDKVELINREAYESEDEIYNVTLDEIVPDTIELITISKINAINRVRGTFTDKTQYPWRENSVTVKIDGLDEDGFLANRVTNLDLKDITDPSFAYRECKDYLMREHFANKILSFNVLHTGIFYKIGSLIKIPDLPKYDGIFRVTKCEYLGNSEYQIKARQYIDDEFSTDIITGSINAPPVLPSVRTITPPSSLTITTGEETTITNSSGSVTYGLKIYVEKDNDVSWIHFTSFDVEVFKTGTPERFSVSISEDGYGLFNGVEDGQEYTVYAKAVNCSGKKSTAITATATPTKKNVAPNNPNSIIGNTYSDGTRIITISGSSTPTDWLGYEAQFNGVSILGSATATTKETRIETFDLTGSGTLRVRSVDNSGNKSGWVSSSVTWGQTREQIKQEQDNATVDAYNWGGSSPVSTTRLNDLAVTNPKLGGTAVTTDKIQALNITEGLLGGSSVTNSKLGGSSVATGNLQPLSVTDVKLGTGSVTNGKLGGSSVGTGNLQPLSVTNGILGNDSVNNSKLGNDSVNGSNIQTNAVGSSEVSALAILEGNLANNAVSTAKLNGYSVTDTKLANGAVSDGKISNLNGSKINNGTVTDGKISNLNGSKLYDNSVVQNKISGTLSDSVIAGVNGSKIFGSSVSGDKLVNYTITETKIGNNSISSGKIQANAVTANEIAANSVGASEIIAGSITANEINANVFSAITINGNQINAGTLSANQITTGTLSADRISGGSIAGTVYAHDLWLRMFRSGVVTFRDIEAWSQDVDSDLTQIKNYLFSGGGTGSIDLMISQLIDARISTHNTPDHTSSGGGGN